MARGKVHLKPETATKAKPAPAPAPAPAPTPEVVVPDVPVEVVGRANRRLIPGTYAWMQRMKAEGAENPSRSMGRRSSRLALKAMGAKPGSLLDDGGTAMETDVLEDEDPKTPPEGEGEADESEGADDSDDDDDA